MTIRLARASAVLVLSAGLAAAGTTAGMSVARSPAAATTTPSATGTGTVPPPTAIVTVQDPRISESSALAASLTHPDLVWTVNDSGHTASVFGVSTITGRTRVVLRLADTDARDWESMAIQRRPDGPALWIGDTGDNNAVRESIVLRLIREPAGLPAAEGATVTVQPVSLRVRYPDGPHDVETLVVTPDGRLLLVSKGIFAGLVYQVPPAAVAAALSGRSTLTPVTATVVGPVRQSLVTDGVALPDGRIVLRGYYDAVIYQDLTAGGQGLRPIERVDLPDQQQGEGLAVVDDGRALLVSSEGVRQPLWRVTLPAGSSATSTPSATTTSAATGRGVPQVVPTEQARAVGGGITRSWWLLVAGAGVPALVLVTLWRLARSRRRP